MRGDGRNTHQVIAWRGRGYIRFNRGVESVKLSYSRRVGENLVNEVLLFCISWRYRSFREYFF
jgi:hypothetical protein